MKFYRFMDSLFLNSLSKKIFACTTIVVAPISFYLIYVLMNLDSKNPETVTEFSDNLTYLLAYTLVSGLVSFFILRSLIKQPLDGMSQALSGISERNGDISIELPVFANDEISNLAKTYNQFSRSLKGMISETRKRSVKVAVASTHMRKGLLAAKDIAEQQDAHAQEMFQSSSEGTTAISEIAETTVHINTRNDENINRVHGSNEDLKQIVAQIKSIQELVLNFHKTVEELKGKSENVTQVVSMVQEFSEQTNLLALNASIEAARAGEHGRGFAVVADEVRNLSSKVNQATVEIDENIRNMNDLVDYTKNSALSIMDYVEKTESYIDNTAANFDNLIQGFQEVGDQINGISASLEELAATNRESHERVSEITDLSNLIKNDMEKSVTFSDNLEIATEETQELLSRFIIGFGGFEDIIQTGRQWAQQVSEALNSLSKTANVFDTAYTRLNPDAEPAQYSVCYLDQAEKVLQPMFDSFKQSRPEFIYAIIVDKNGYAVTHHKAVSKPFTGDFAFDNANCRNKRIFDSTRAEKRRASHTTPFLLQTYIRDTGEVLNDLSIPIYINGKHYGAFIMGFDPKILLDETTQ